MASTYAHLAFTYPFFKAVPRAEKHEQNGGLNSILTIHFRTGNLAEMLADNRLNYDWSNIDWFILQSLKNMIAKKLVRVVSVAILVLAAPIQSVVAQSAAPAEPEVDGATQNRILQKEFDKFPLLKSKVDEKGNVEKVDLVLNKNPVIIGGQRFDGFRFVADRKGKEDFIWEFQLPKNVKGWYIIPQTGEMDGFNNFQPLDDHKFVQELAGDSLETGKSYLIWFTISDDQPATVSLAFKFASLDWSKDDGPTYENEKKALYPAPK